MRGAAALLAACCLGIAAPAAAGEHEIVIGVIAGVTGPGAAYGTGIVQGAAMAVNEVNAAGGVNGRKLRLQVEDDRSDPARSAIAMRRLLSSSPALIVGGHGSPQVLAHKDFAEESSLPYIVVAATHPAIVTGDDRWIFRVVQNDVVMLDELARLAVAGLRLRRIAVVHDENVYGSGSRDLFIAALGRHGAKAVDVQSYRPSDKDFRPLLARVKAAAPDAIALFGTVPAVPAIMNQARELGVAARFLGSGGLANEALLHAAPAAAEGAILASFFSDDHDAATAAWSRRYREAYADRRSPSPALAAWEYRAIRDIAVPCLRSVGTDRPALRECIARWHGRMFGLSGEVYFDAAGQLVYPAIFVEVRGGAFKSLGKVP